ncbi:MAG: PPC domain-containing protein [Gemmatimonadaceae bacterium]
MRTVFARPFLSLVIVASVVGCSEHITGVTPGKPTLMGPIAAQALLQVTCTATVVSRVVTCGNPASNDEVFSDVIIGGQNVYVTLTSFPATTTPGADCPGAVSPDPTKSCYSFNMTVTNLIPQPLGTSDTTGSHALDPNGVRVFFHSGPTSTGIGTVIVANPDGTGSFTGTNQPYFQTNAVIEPNLTSGPKHWEFQYTSNVTAFSFTVYVSAAVPYPDGYIDGLAKVITLNHTGTFTLPGTSRTFVGNPDGAAIVFTSANPALASVSGAVVTAGATNGFTTITAQSGLRPGISSTWISVCPSVVVANGANFAAAIANTDCFVAFDRFTLLPSTDRFGDLYRVTLAAGQTVVFSLDNGLSGLDTYLILADRLGNVLDVNDDFFAGGGSQITYTNNTGVAGVAVFQATTYNSGDTGAYTVIASVTP